MTSKAALVHQILRSHRVDGSVEMDRGELCRRAGISWRTLRLVNEELREQGILVLSRGEGYYLAVHSSEIEEAYRYRRAYAMTILRDLRYIRRARQRMIDSEVKQGELFKVAI